MENRTSLASFLVFVLQYIAAQPDLVEESGKKAVARCFGAFLFWSMASGTKSFLLSTQSGGIDFNVSSLQKDLAGLCIDSGTYESMGFCCLVCSGTLAAL